VGLECLELVTQQAAGENLILSYVTRCAGVATVRLGELTERARAQRRQTRRRCEIGLLNDVRSVDVENVVTRRREGQAHDRCIYSAAHRASRIIWNSGHVRRSPP